ncbi:response regulator transcription factor [Dehalobacter sp.]|uniref:response regulator transcription factor n=1 Tax=Dehalobacter sp. TaxID=1962289 RepID=UPI0025864423|nr:response regulator transcription factor [Dehalobacter sp.]MCG1024857.1 response regulator transcription factor [Dehalobacter sp.]
MKKILIIDDNSNSAQLDRDYLEANYYEVDISCYGVEGLKKALSIEYNLIILDSLLPDIDSFKICREISEKKDIPIILVSERNELLDKIKGFGLGAADYLVKPFEILELIARVNAHVNRYERIKSKSKSQSTLQIGSFKIEKNARRIFLKDQEIFLPNKEFDILTYFAENPNVVFSKEKIFNAIWGLDSDADHSTVAVHINRLREKIEIDPSKPKYIETVWGAGYRFSV